MDRYKTPPPVVETRDLEDEGLDYDPRYGGNVEISEPGARNTEFKPKEKCDDRGGGEDGEVKEQDPAAPCGIAPIDTTDPLLDQSV